MKDIKVGDTVLYPLWGLTELKWEGKDYYVAKESDIMATVTE